MINGLEAFNEKVRFYSPFEQENEIIEKELKDYQEIKEIAEHYNWDDITNEIFSIKTDKKYRDLFDSAIINIQEDYRKARALEIIKEKVVDIYLLYATKNLEDYNSSLMQYNANLTQEEYDILTEVMR